MEAILGNSACEGGDADFQTGRGRVTALLVWQSSEMNSNAMVIRIPIQGPVLVLEVADRR